METQLSNLHLLDDSLSDSVSLKKQRLSNIEKTATNPNPKPNPTPTPQPKMVVVEKDEDDEDEDDDDVDTNEERGNDYEKGGINYSSISNNSKSSTNNDVDEKKILGMKPAVFYTLLGAVVLIGGLVVYNKYFKNSSGSKGKSLGGSSDAGASAAKIATTPAATSATAPVTAPVSNVGGAGTVIPK